MAGMPGSRKWVGETLRGLRKASGLSGVRAAKAAGISQPRISRIETGLMLPTEAEIREFARLYKIPAGLRRELLATEADLRQQEFPARAVISSGQGWKMQLRIRRVEHGSAEVWNYQPAMIAGLLQTPEYATVVWGGDLDEDGRRWLDERIKRQAILDTGAQMMFLMAEGALRWQGGSAQIMAGQLARLVEIIRTRPNVRIGVIPQYRPADVFTTHGFSVYDRSTVIVGVTTGTSFISDPANVGQYVDLFGHLEKLAVFGEEAAGVIARAAQDYN